MSLPVTCLPSPDSEADGGWTPYTDGALLPNGSELSCRGEAEDGPHGLSGETERGERAGTSHELVCGRGRAHGTPELRCRAQPGPRARTWLGRGLTALQLAEGGVRAVCLRTAISKKNMKISGIREGSTLENNNYHSRDRLLRAQITAHASG